MIYVKWTLDIASLSGMSQAYTLMRFLTKWPGFFKHILSFHLLLKTNERENFKTLMVKKSSVLLSEFENSLL